MVKKVLMLMYSFPPTGGPGVQRNAKFIKYIRDFNWEPIVFTRKTGNMPIRDDSLVPDIPADIKVIRTSSWELTEFQGILQFPGKFISRKLLIPDGQRLWQMFGNSKAAGIMHNEKPNLLYTSSLPYSAHLAGLRLKKLYPSIPWVADFRDEWTNNPYLLDRPHNRIRMGIERSMEKRVLAEADYLITNTPVMMDNFIKLNPNLKLADNFSVIPNGYDEDDFKPFLGITPSNSKFTITYTGGFYGRRKPDYFFHALSKLIMDKVIDKHKIKVDLIGYYNKNYMDECIGRYELQNIVNTLPYMRHDECILKMMQSDALLLIEGAGPNAEAFYTGKVFEYMYTGRPIIAAVPVNGSAASIIRDTRTGFVSDSLDISGIAENISSLYKSWLNNKSTEMDINHELVSKFSRRELTRKLAEIFDSFF